MSADTWLTLGTLLLVAITGYYAWTTSRLVREAIRSRRPVVIPLIDFIAPDYAELRILNAGAGAADHLILKFAWSPGGPQRDWTGALAAGDSESFKLVRRGESLSNLLQNHDSIRVIASYSDGVGGGFRLDQSVPVREMFEQSEAAQRLIAPRTFGDRLVSELKAIARMLDELKPKA